MSAFIDLTGSRYGLVQVLWPAGRYKSGETTFVHWAFQCDCGKVGQASGNNLNRRKIISCGCIKGKWNKTHGLRNTSEYASYSSAKSRCRREKDERWSDYGGRGIQFRFGKFQEFFAVVGPRPKGGILDRIDNDGHYEAGNVRWTTSSISNKNRRRFRRDGVPSA